MSRIVDQGNQTNTDGQMGELISTLSSVGPAYTLPGEAWLSSATLSQDGFDLVLTLDGVTHRVGDYFSFQTPLIWFLKPDQVLPRYGQKLIAQSIRWRLLVCGAAGPGLESPLARSVY